MCLPLCTGNKRVALGAGAAQFGGAVGVKALRISESRGAASGTGRGSVAVRAAITMPQEEEHAWRRLVNGGVAQASELWGTVNSAASAAAKGTWEGFKPAHKAGLSLLP